jgi:hypothetical protein
MDQSFPKRLKRLLINKMGAQSTSVYKKSKVHYVGNNIGKYSEFALIEKLFI